ncbi:MAG: sulfurtransferase [Thermoplasmata archaeon]|nr:sulfurtransferase [Thermoplasmata archaeon]MCI4358959.1 sulfurtransferase [Thermoplasmata archaeon]
MVDELAPTEVAKRLSDPSQRIVLLDVREDWERARASILPSIHIPMQQISQRLSEVPPERSIIVYCHGGTRSAMVAAFLSARGFPTVANLAGGIDAWSEEVDPTIPRY